MKFIITGYQQVIQLIQICNHYLTVLDEMKLEKASFIISDGVYFYTYEQALALKLISFKIVDNHFVRVDEQILVGTTLTHLAYSHRFNRLLGASYHDGTIGYVSVKEGYFTQAWVTIGDHSEQGLSRPHWLGVSPKEDEVAVVNISQDRIGIYDAASMHLKRDLYLPKGCGPRHALWNQQGTRLFVVTEYSNQVMCIDGASGSFIAGHSTLSTLNPFSYGATLCFDRNEEHLYVSNRGDDTIACFRVVDNNFILESHIPTFGQHSRHMILSHDETYLISANKNSNQVVWINTKTHEKEYTHPFVEPSGLVEVLLEKDSLCII
ncbi:MAG: beta-propeller fold lactonase family protein [Bacilli bacterium]